LAPSLVYAPSPAPHTPAPLRQGEIIPNLIQFYLDAASLGSEDAVVGQQRAHPFAVIITQDCDLEQDFKVRQKNETSDKLLPSILFCEVAKAEEMLGRVRQHGGSRAWNRIRMNKDERYHFLQQIEPADDALGKGLPEMAIDFKRYFTIPSDELYGRLALGEAQRRCVLQSPYVQHLSSRFAYYLSRVALPQEHASI
jgi:hypothetical protein